MLTLYSHVQLLHNPTHVIKKGRPSLSYETPRRVTSILSAIEMRGLGPVVEPEPADLEVVNGVHDPGMLAYLQTAVASSREDAAEPAPLFPTFFPPPGQRRQPKRIYGQRGYYCTDTGASVGPHTWESAQASAACAAAGARQLLSGEHCVYALCRPPGHHAGPDFFGGYCYLNNAAVAAHVLRRDGCRVAILDIDYHHGNGTQAFFWRDPQVWYGSLHIDPALDYPFFAGYADEIGSGPGEGTVCNVPLGPHTTQAQYRDELDRLLSRLARFDPDYLVLSAGLDTYAGDPVGGFGIGQCGYREIGRKITSGGLPTLIVQEGGYNTADLGRCVVALLSGIEDTPSDC
jgi:acetoin utilization deacetylase AcuC-like enzyme